RVAERCRAAGLGSLAGLMVPASDLRKAIRRVRELTDRPFGVNLWLHSGLRPPIDPATIPDATLAGAQTVLNQFRTRLGVRTMVERPPRGPDLISDAFEVIREERPAVFSSALGFDPAMIKRCHERGIKAMTMATTVDEARRMAAAGADVIVAQGGEAGGHRSVDGKPASPESASVGTMVLVPQVAEAVRVPGVAGGGIRRGRGLGAARARGARAV